jgi:hypothetical protein
MADNTKNPPASDASGTPGAGFTLPTPSSGAAQTAAPPPNPAVTFDPGSAQDSGLASRDLLIGGAVLLVLMVAFFFAKNAYATSLVRKRIEPRSANAAGWWLWVFLTLLSVGSVLAVVSKSALMTPFIVIPLGVAAVVALVLMLLASRR